MTEEWRPIAGHSDYRVSNLGNVLSLRRRRPRLMTPVLKNHGYLAVNLRCDGGTKVRTRTVHTLVAEAFLGPRPDGMLVLHGDGNPLNNVVSNLRWGTPRDNWQDAIDHGYVPRGHASVRASRRTHCSRGHRYDGLLANGQQRCLSCERMHGAWRRARDRAKSSPATSPV